MKKKREYKKYINYFSLLAILFIVIIIYHLFSKKNIRMEINPIMPKDEVVANWYYDLASNDFMDNLINSDSAFLVQLNKNNDIEIIESIYKQKQNSVSQSNDFYFTQDNKLKYINFRGKRFVLFLRDREIIGINVFKYKREIDDKYKYSNEVAEFRINPSIVRSIKFSSNMDMGSYIRGVESFKIQNLYNDSELLIEKGDIYFYYKQSNIVVSQHVSDYMDLIRLYMKGVSK